MKEAEDNMYGRKLVTDMIQQVTELLIDVNGVFGHYFKNSHA